MSHRLYALLADAEAAERAVAELRTFGLDESQLHAVARHDPNHELPEAGLTETSDITGAAGRGAAAGAATGVLAGLAAVAFPPAGIVIAGGWIAAGGALGAGFGAWAASMIGISEDSDQVAAYHDAIKAGAVLLMVDCDDQSPINAVRQRIAHADPSADVQDAGAIE